jgi:hypothetical protein
LCRAFSVSWAARCGWSRSARQGAHDHQDQQGAALQAKSGKTALLDARVRRKPQRSATRYPPSWASPGSSWVSHLPNTWGGALIGARSRPRARSVRRHSARQRRARGGALAGGAHMTAAALRLLAALALAACGKKGAPSTAGAAGPGEVSARLSRLPSVAPL